MSRRRRNVEQVLFLPTSSQTGRGSILFWRSPLSVPGVADLVLYGKHGPLLVADLKVVGDGTWSRTKNSPKPEHRAQANLYAWALGAPRWSVCYVHASTGELREHFGATDAFEARRDFGAFEEAAYWLRKGTPPPRPYEDAEQFPCRFCDHSETCWKGAPANVSLPQTGRA